METILLMKIEISIAIDVILHHLLERPYGHRCNPVIRTPTTFALILMGKRSLMPPICSLAHSAGVWDTTWSSCCRRKNATRNDSMMKTSSFDGAERLAKFTGLVVVVRYRCGYTGTLFMYIVAVSSALSALQLLLWVVSLCPVGIMLLLDSWTIIMRRLPGKMGDKNETIVSYKQREKPPTTV